jgi:ribonuclease D
VLPPPLYIDSEPALRQWADRLAHTQVVAVDTESDSFHRYREKVCLIQMTALDQDVIIDPLRLPNLDPLRQMFADPKVVKIFHDAGYDLLCLRRDFGFEPRGLFDTMLASRLLGQTQFGLAALLRERFAFEADKKQQRSDWAQRPLSDAQLDYARYDTHFLPALHQALRAELQAVGRLGWAEEDFARLPSVSERLSAKSPIPPELLFWRVTGARALPPPARGRLQALVQLREQLAQQLDRPAFRVFSDALLLELANQAPGVLPDLQPQPGLRHGGIRRFGPQIMSALGRAKPVFGEPPPGVSRRRRTGRLLEATAKDRYEDLRTLRSELSKDLGLEPDVTLSNALLEELARQPPTDLAQLAGRPELQGWRGPRFVEPLMRLLSKPPQVAAPKT